MTKTIIAVALAAALSTGCGGVRPEPPTAANAQAMAGPQPTAAEAEELILRTLKSKLKDPDSIKQFRVQGPVFVNTDQWVGLLYGGTRRVIGWLYCAEYNAKNSYGAYGGVENMAFLIRNNNGPWVLETDRTCPVSM